MYIKKQYYKNSSYYIGIYNNQFGIYFDDNLLDCFNKELLFEII